MKKIKVTYLHGFVVKTEKGTRCLNSSVMCSAKGGLEMEIQHTFEPAYSFPLGQHLMKAAEFPMLEMKHLPGQDSAGSGVLRARNKHKATAIVAESISVHLG